MTLELYIEQLQKFVEKHPEALKFQVIHSSDDEGNSFHSVQFSPTLGTFDENELTFDNHRELNYESNSVCIN